MAKRVGNSENLKERDRYDILLFDFPDGYPNSKLDFVFGATPRRISGVEKVVQIFVKCLLTSQGSDPIRPSHGTAFGNYIRYANVATFDVAEVKTMINTSVKDATDQAKAILNSVRYSKESQLDTVKILGISQGRDGTAINLRVLTRAGRYAPVAIPFTSTGLIINE